MSVTARITPDFIYRFGKVSLELRARTHLMGILNATPDSFSDGGKFAGLDAALRRIHAMVEEGADIIDIGGESTRPGSRPVPEEEEMERVLPIIEQAAKEVPVPISVDTRKARVADEALKAGAAIVNDISALKFDAMMAETIARHRATVILMHMKGTPQDMQDAPQYDDVVTEVTEFLSVQARRAEEGGIRQIIVDPGIGFGKTLQHNLTLLRNLDRLHSVGYPIMTGPSRKSFIGAVLDLPVEERLEGTAAAVTASILRGAHIVRVHDVKAMRRVARMADALRNP